MARTKLKRIVAVKELKNVFRINDDGLISSLQEYFKTERKLTLEIGCGSGEYSVELATRFPERNFVGIDVKAARIFIGASKAINIDLNNVAFLLARAEKLDEIFPERSIQEIYIPFPDPHFRRANHSRRLISRGFLKIYRRLLSPNGLIHFKTDNAELYEYALKNISDFGCKIVFNTNNLYKVGGEFFFPNIKTSFELHYIKQGRVIRYICFMF